MFFKRRKASDEEPVSSIYEDLSKLNSSKARIQLEYENGKRHEETFHQRKYTDGR